MLLTAISPETVVSAAVAFAVPLLFAGLGECLAERSGVINIGVEGLMLAAALASVVASHFTGSSWVGLLAGLGAAAALGALFAGIVVYRNANQVVTGTALNILALGLTGSINGTLTARLAERSVSRLAGVKLPDWPVPGFSTLPVVGETVFRSNVLVYLAFLLVPITALLLARTRLGLHVRAVGEHPLAAEAAGVDVRRLRLLTVTAGAALAGMGGTFLAIGHVSTFVENMVAGRGFIALALVIFGRWNPWGVLAGTAVFSLATGVAVDLSKSGRGDPREVFLLALPYVATLVALLFRSGRSPASPAALGQPYVRA